MYLESFFRLTNNHRSPRPYQLDAIDAWVSSGYSGILAMATGTGKTYTSLLAVEGLLRVRDNVKAIIIAVPFEHLVDQWAEEFIGTDVLDPVKAYKNTAKWTAELAEARLLNKYLGKPVVIITTYTTLAADYFFEIIEAEAEETVLIADECHYLGAPSRRKFMELPIPMRLGLSATPERHFDSEGTKALLDYFGSIVFEFDMEQAIEERFLTPYNYFPEFVELTMDESEDYVTLTERISRAAAIAESTHLPEDRKHLEFLLIQRARVVNNAYNKLGWLESKFVDKPREDLSYTLVYTGEDLFEPVLRLLGDKLRIPVHSFTGWEHGAKRKKLLREFASGALQVLVAMRCLDEGVDVPATKNESSPIKCVNSFKAINHYAATTSFFVVPSDTAAGASNTLMSR